MATHTYRTEIVQQLTDESFQSNATEGWDVVAVVPRLPAQTDYVVIWRRDEGPLGTGTGVI